MYDYADHLTQTTVAELRSGDQLPLFNDDREPFMDLNNAKFATGCGVSTTDYVSEVHHGDGWSVIETADGRVFYRPTDTPIVVRRALREASK